MASGDSWKPKPFKTDFVDVSAHLPDVRGSMEDAAKSGMQKAFMTRGPLPVRVRAGLREGFSSLAHDAVGYMRSDKARTVWQGVQQNNRAMAEREGR